MVGTVEQFIQRAPEMPPPLTKVEQLVLGTAVRLSLPVHELRKHQLVRLADLLRGVANTIENAGRRTDLTEFHALLDVRREVEHAKMKIADLTKE